MSMLGTCTPVRVKLSRLRSQPRGHGWKAGGRRELIEADVAFGIIVGEDGSHPTQEDGNALVPTRESMVEVLKNGNVLTVLFERFESFGHFVVWPGLVCVREKGFLVDAVIIGKTYEALDRLSDFLSRLDFRQRFKHGQSDRYPCCFEKIPAVQCFVSHVLAIFSMFLSIFTSFLPSVRKFYYLRVSLKASMLEFPWGRYDIFFRSFPRKAKWPWLVGEKRVNRNQ